MIRRFPVLEASAVPHRAVAWTRDPGEPPQPRLAATVMCLRDGAGGVEVFMLHRVASMAFAPSMHVFPGGGVDVQDGRDDLPWAGPPAARWAGSMSTDDATARMLLAAAVREVFEETGILLASPPTARPDADDGRVPTAASPSDPWGLAQARRMLVAHETSLAEVLVKAGLVLRSDLLSYRAHWTTPEFEPRRYDTRFFATRIPEGQVADDGSTEAQAAGWVRPAELLESAAAGEALLLPPTIICLELLAQAHSAGAFLREEPAVREVLPTLEERPDGLSLVVDLP